MPALLLQVHRQLKKVKMHSRLCVGYLKLVDTAFCEKAKGLSDFSFSKAIQAVLLAVAFTDRAQHRTVSMPAPRWPVHNGRSLANLA